MSKILDKVKKVLRAALLNNWTLKIASAAIALLIWLAVVNVSDPTKTVTINNIPITVTDESAVTDLNQVYTVVSDDTATITVTGKRSVVEALSEDDFTATASLSEMSQVYSVPVTVAAKKESVAKNISITQKTWTITVEVEDIVTQTYDLSITLSGTAAEGYVAGSVTAGKSSIDITAPESVHKRISSVKAEVDITDVSESFSDKFDIYVYDKNDNIITDSNMKLSSDKVKVQVDVMEVKEVPIVITVYGEPASGYEYVGMTYTPETVQIIGEDEDIDGVTSITVPEKEVDITGMTESAEIVLDLAKYLPENVSIYGQESDITVTVTIKALISKKYTITTDNIIMNNIPDGYEAEMINEASITLVGIEDAFIDFDENDLNATVDLSNAIEGTNVIKIAVSVPDGVTIKNNVYARIKLTAIVTEDEMDETGETGEETTASGTNDENSGDDTSE